MREHNDIANEIDGTDYCEVCEQAVNWTTTISVDYGDVDICWDCIINDADRSDANTAALRAGDEE